MLEQRVGRQVKAMRERRGLTQAQLAEGAKLSPNTVSRIERGTQAPSFEALERLAHTLGVDPVELFLQPGQVVGGEPDVLPDAVDALQDRLRRALAILRSG